MKELIKEEKKLQEEGQRWTKISRTKTPEFKGDEEDYNIRARLIAQEFSRGKLETIFAARPPWEAKKTLKIKAFYL